MLRTIRLFKELACIAFGTSNDKLIEDGGGKTNETVVNSSKNKKSKKLTRLPKIKAIKEPNFLTPNA